MATTKSRKVGKKLKAKQILLTPSHESMIAQMRERLSHFTDAETIRYCIAFTYGKHFKDYVESSRTLMTPEMRERHKFIQKQAKDDAVKQVEQEEGERICELLEGEVETDLAGEKTCHWKVHTIMAGGVIEVGEMTLPLDRMTDEMVAQQYEPSKEKVIQLRTNNENSNQ